MNEKTLLNREGIEVLKAVPEMVKTKVEYFAIGIPLDARRGTFCSRTAVESQPLMLTVGLNSGDKSDSGLPDCSPITLVCRVASCEAIVCAATFLYPVRNLHKRPLESFV